VCSSDLFLDLWKKIELSNSGEPGIYLTNNPDWGTNPCCEIALRPYQFCNLCEVNVSNVISQEDLNNRVKAATFFGTLQAGFTDFHYLRPIWKKTTEKDALVGIGMTGIASMEVFKYDLTQAAKEGELINIELSQTLGINRAARVTCVKPSGTTSCVLGTSSGIHAWHNDYYLRTVRFNKSQDIAKYLLANHPEICEEDLLDSNTLCVRIPIKAPDNAVLRTETAIDILERVKKVAQEWIKPGHINGDNSHNVSATISIDKNRTWSEDISHIFKDIKGGTWTGSETVFNEWEVVGEWMWENKEFYNGLSVLPYFGGSYKQAPFEDITKEKYEELVKHLHSIDLTKLIEETDETTLVDELACVGSNCEIK
jgi:ribonucleoside-diphosphate reductase alpha chain